MMLLVVILAAAQVAVSPVAATDSALRGDATASAWPARIITVSSTAALQAALYLAWPGDRIELRNGVYTASSSIRIGRSGTRVAPITVAAQHIGGAEITGPAGFTFDGGVDFVDLQGFKFTHAAEIRIPVGSDNVRFSHNLVQLSGGKNWVTVAGDNAEVDHNTFQNKSTEGVFLQISGPGEHGMALRPRIHRNYFRNHTFGGTNGGESIRLGASTRQLASASATVEYNLFEHADGDTEAISVKSSHNTVRFNTLRNSRGSIVLRSGNGNWVDGNLMLGGSAGLRFYDNDHVLVNNLIQGGTGQIVAGSGEIADVANGGIEHGRPDRVMVAFNTVVGNRTALLQIGRGTDGLGPNQCTFANNILVGGGSGALIDIDESTRSTWHGNIVWAGTGGNAPSGGFRVVNPILTVDAGGLNRLSSTSPAINTAAGTNTWMFDDFDRQDRQARFGADLDVGADEFRASGVHRRPLSASDVGPNAS